MEIETLFEEVALQLSTIDDYNQSVFSNFLQTLSLTAIPVVVLSTLGGTNIITLSDGYKMTTGMFAGIGLLIGIMVWLSTVIYKIFKD